MEGIIYGKYRDISLSDMFVAEKINAPRWMHVAGSTWNVQFDVKAKDDRRIGCNFSWSLITT